MTWIESPEGIFEVSTSGGTMPSPKHIYPTLRDAVLAVLRIYPLSTQKVRGKLRLWKRDGMLSFAYHADGVTVSLLSLQEEGKVEQVGTEWRVKGA